MISGSPNEPCHVDLDGTAVQGIGEAFHVEAQVVEYVDFGGWMTLEGFRPSHAGQEVEREKEGGGSAGLLDVEESTTNKTFVQMTAIGRIGDDVAGWRSRVSEEVHTGESEPVIGQIAGDDGVSGLAEFLNNGSLAASGLPYGAVEGDAGEKRSRGGRMRWVEVQLSAAEVGIWYGAGSRCCSGSEMRVHGMDGEEIRAFYGVFAMVTVVKEEPVGVNP